MIECKMDHSDPDNIPLYLCRVCSPPKLVEAARTVEEVSTPMPASDFAEFRVDPDEIEAKIRVEADKRWRMWTPTKDHLTRPRRAFYEKQVRKEFYP